MGWEIEYTDEFGKWWDSLRPEVREKIDGKVGLLEVRGPALGRPHADTVKGSRHQNLKELIIQYAGDPYRIFYAFDPRRCAILLIGGIKFKEGRFYEEFIPLANQLYDEHLEILRKEGYLDG
jgi:hypothetical protein